MKKYIRCIIPFIIIICFLIGITSCTDNTNKQWQNEKNRKKRLKTFLLIGDGMLRELKGFDEGVSGMLEWAKGRDDTAIFITADHETGGFVLDEIPEGDRYNAVVSDDGGYTYRPKYYRWTTDSHTVTMSGYGFSGLISILKTIPIEVHWCQIRRESRIQK